MSIRSESQDLGAGRNSRTSLRRSRLHCPRRLLACTLLLAVGAAGAVLAAGPPAAEKPTSKNTTTSKDRKRYLFLYMGGFEAAETAAVLDHPADSFSFGGGSGWRFHRFLTLELDLNMSSTAYDLPRGISREHRSDDKLELTTLGALGSVKLGRRFGRVRPQVGVGLGAGMIDVSLSNPDYFALHSLETQFTLLTQILVGFDVRVGRRSYLGIEYRKLFAGRTISFGGEEIDGGGESGILAYRFAF